MRDVIRRICVKLELVVSKESLRMDMMTVVVSECIKLT